MTPVTPVTPVTVASVAIVTVVRGRRDHLRRQRIGIQAQTRPPDQHVIVDLGGPPIAASPRTVVVPYATDAAALPLAAARNRGADIADADVVIFLDVDCIPSAGLVADYVDLCALHRGVVCGPVGYLPRVDADAYFDGNGHVRIDRLRALSNYQRGRPRPHEATRRTDHFELFWSLSFALDRDTWHLLGGFDVAFDGYGGEDTDLAWTARERGVGLFFSGRAEAFHQHHAISSPPVEHLDDIVRNATTFRRKWGEWPMAGWLAEFADRGLIEWTPSSSTIAPRRGRSRTTPGAARVGHQDDDDT